MNINGQSANRRSLVIVVDDDPAVRNSLKFALELEGFEVRAYAGGADLLRDTAAFADGCLVVDYKMPGMSGLDLVARLREQHIMTPAILMTSYPNSAVSKRASDAGVPIVEKPLLGNGLIDSIRASLRRDAQPALA